jgi:hypothetical protein
VYATPRNYVFDKICLFPKAGYLIGGYWDSHGSRSENGIRDSIRGSVIDYARPIALPRGHSISRYAEARVDGG